MLSIAFGSLALASYAVQLAASQDICALLQNSLSDVSDVYYTGSDGYASDVYHWSEACIQASLCSVEPGSVEDVAVILQLVGSTRTPFAVKGGGHATNPTFSDTSGVQIAMTRFRNIDYDSTTETAKLGAGLTWDVVYATMDTYGANIAGGRAGVGVAGLALGGGYSWLTNQHGLTLDTIIAFELVKPDGTIATITETSDADLFFALKGSHSNFGIVTQITFRTYPQGQIWGGALTFAADQVDDFTAAAATFVQDNTDLKAQIVFNYIFVAGMLIPGIFLFYDGPEPPNGIFDDFLAIPAASNDVHTRSFYDMVASFPAGDRPSNRTTYHTVSLEEISVPILDACLNETIYWGTYLSSLVPGAFVAYIFEPFSQQLFSYNTSPSAYPPKRDIPLFPQLLEYSWPSVEYDNLFFDSIRASQEQIIKVAIADGQSNVRDASLYPNYALYTTPLKELYGDNVEKLRTIKARVDPDNVMGLSGGFNF